jgi:hypothetical protein
MSGFDDRYVNDQLRPFARRFAPATSSGELALVDRFGRGRSTRQ